MTKFYKEGDLVNYLEKKGINHLLEPDAFIMFKQIARGVHDCHEKGVVHRDLKHLNILITLVDDKPVAKLTDFGMAV